MNRRTGLITATIAVAAACVVPLAASPAGAAATPAPTTCHGEDASIISIPDDGTLAGTPAPGTRVVRRSEGFPVVQGTPGRDVVVISDDGVPVDTGAGDDLLCVVGRGGSTGGSLGEGADTVDATRRAPFATPGGVRLDVEAELGPGDDAYAGGAAHESVGTGSGRDLVATGDGADLLLVRDNLGAADLGPGDDRVFLDGAMAGGITSGGGADVLTLLLVGDAVDLDNAAGRVTVNGTTTPLSGFMRFGAATSTSIQYAPATWSSFRFRGSDAAETLDLRPVLAQPQGDAPVPSTGAVDIDLAGGDDTLLHDLYVHGRMLGGAGRDAFDTAARWRAPRRPDVTAAVDLGSGTFRVRHSGAPRSALLGFESVALAGFDALDFKGSSADEALTAQAGRFSVDMGRGADTVVLADTRVHRLGRRRIDGGPGADVVELVGANRPTVIHGGPGDDDLAGGNRGDRISGAAGDDRLTGGAGRDVLRGGTGRDEADGGPGRDVCRAETRTAC